MKGPALLGLRPRIKYSLRTHADDGMTDKTELNQLISERWLLSSWWEEGEQWTLGGLGWAHSANLCILLKDGRRVDLAFRYLGSVMRESNPSGDTGHWNNSAWYSWYHVWPVCEVGTGRDAPSACRACGGKWESAAVPQSWLSLLLGRRELGQFRPQRRHSSPSLTAENKGGGSHSTPKNPLSADSPPNGCTHPLGLYCTRPKSPWQLSAVMDV